MPAVSFYLNQDVLDSVRLKAKAENIPISRLIREAIENYLGVEKKKKARDRVLQTLIKERPLGGMEDWEEIHRQRTLADADRC